MRVDPVEKLTIDPPPRRFIIGIARWMQKNMPLRLMRRQSSQSFGAMSSIAARGPATPTLFTRTVRSPIAAAASLKISPTASWSPTSPSVPVILGLAASVSSSGAFRTSQIWTLSPRARQRSAIALPTLSAPPVTRTASVTGSVSDLTDRLLRCPPRSPHRRAGPRRASPAIRQTQGTRRGPPCPPAQNRCVHSACAPPSRRERV